MSCQFLPLFVSNASLFSVRRCGYLILFLFSFKGIFSIFFFLSKGKAKPSALHCRGKGDTVPDGVASSSNRDGYR